MPKSVLLADDSITIRKVVAMLFHTEDFALTSVDNGIDALKLAREKMPDLVLLDCVMPGKNGYEVCEALKNDPATAGLKVILLAGTFEPFDPNRAQAVRADAHLVKPFDSTTFLNQVKTICGMAANSTVGPVRIGAPVSAPVAAPAMVAPPAPARPVMPPAPPAPPAQQFARPLGAPMAPPRAPGMPPAPPMGQPGMPMQPGMPPRPMGMPPAPAGMPPRPPMPGMPPGPGFAPRPPMAGQPQMPPGPAFGSPGQPMAPRAPGVPGIPGGMPGMPPRPPAPMGGPAPMGAPRDPFGLRPGAMPAGQPMSQGPQIMPGAPPGPARPADGGEAALRQALSMASKEVIERIAWEVVPQLAETIIREELERLIKDREARGLA
jgi:CheY-like chemotaxis protein